ncbi:MAG: DUF308 domain-containing protein [Butyrivibrio sp.]|nr:DUF308 domain-containing protein [Butyrivibrio sp.]
MSMKRDKIMAGGALLILGVLFLTSPTTTTRLIYSAIGVVLALTGLVRLIMALRIKEWGVLKVLIIIVSVILMILGIVLMINPDILIAYNYIIFGLIMIINGMVNIISVIKGEMQTTGNKIIYIALSLILLIVGVVIIIHPFSAAEMLTKLIGIMLIASGIINLVIALNISWISSEHSK